jgi:hypothetical protein
LNLNVGWNLVGKTSSGSLNVAAVFGDLTKVITVWKWIASTAKWAFYTPLMDVATLQTYAASKAYDVLSTINGGEGFWVNTNITFAAQVPTGSTVNSASFQNMGSGWNLIATGENNTPRDFNNQISLSPPSPGVIPNNLTTLWAWDNPSSKWYFYAPSLDASSGLSAYINSKGYLDFTAAGKTLGQGVGFWVNKP